MNEALTTRNPKLTLFAVALVAALVFHWRAFFSPSTQPKGVDDVPGIIAGYHATLSLVAGLGGAVLIVFSMRRYQYCTR